jgi:hypothetical protein
MCQKFVVLFKFGVSFLANKHLFIDTRSGSTVVEHSPYHPKDEGYSPAHATETYREKKNKAIRNFFYSLLVIAKCFRQQLIVSN